MSFQPPMCDKCHKLPAQATLKSPTGFYSLCFTCLNKQSPDLSRTINNMINQQQQQKEKQIPKRDRRNLVSYESFAEKPEIQLIFCETCNFFPISHLPTLGRPYCKRCGTKFRITVFPLQSLPSDSYIINKLQN